MSLRQFDLFNPSDEHQMLRRSIAAFVRDQVEPQAQACDKEEHFNIALFRKLGELGLLGITVPEQYGGSGLDPVAAVIAHEEISYSDPGFCLAYLAHSMLCTNNLAVNGNEEQKQRYLPKLCSGEWIGAMGMSEPGTGTDVLAMQSRAQRDGEDYLLTGRKMWITNGVVDNGKTPCDVVLVYAATSNDSSGRPAISSFLVEAGHAGFQVGQKIRDKLGMRASNTAELVFDACRLSKSQLMGSEGESMVHMMKNLEIERVTLAAMSVGIARRCIDIMVRYSKERKAFGKSIYKFGQIQRFIAESYAEMSAARCYVYNTAAHLKLDSAGQRIDSDGVKLFAARTAKEIADRAIQVLGGYGYVGEYQVERLWRDAKLLEIGGGTNEAHQKNICNDLVKALG
jgi:isovaleryl-CoA dehydrogenase